MTFWRALLMMKKMQSKPLFAALALWLATPAFADYSGPISPSGPLQTTPQAIFNPSDFGAACNAQVNISSGVLTNPSTAVDDTVALNNMFAAWKVAAGKGPAAVVGPRTGYACKTTSPLNLTSSVSNVARGSIVRDLFIFASFSSNGPIGTLAIAAAGTGGTPGTYTSVALTGGTGSGCVASSVVVGAGGGVTSVVLPMGGCGGVINGGTDYADGDTLTAAPGSVSGFSLTVASTSGRAALDIMGNRYIDFQNTLVYGDCTSAQTKPNVAVAIGRNSNGVSADNFRFGYPVVNGCFTLTDFYDLASETNLFDHPEFWTANTSGLFFGLILDGANHWNWNSDGFTAWNTPVETPQSFIDADFIEPDIRVNGDPQAIPVWMTTTHRLQMTSYYFAGSGSEEVLVWSANASEYERDADFKGHIETNADQNCFLFTGGNPSITVNSIRVVDDHTSNCNTSVFATDSSITSATMNGAHISFDGFASGASVALFSNPSIWTGSGDVYLPSAGNWTPPASWQGSVCVLSACYPIVPTQAINRNPDFVMDQKFAGAANAASGNLTLIVDGWRQSTSGGVSNTMTYTRSAAAPPNGYVYSEQAATRTATTPTSAQYLAMQQAIEASDLNVLHWGTNQAIPAILDFCAKNTVAGTYTASIGNIAFTETYLMNFTLNNANTWQCFSEPIPAISTGTWNNIPDTIGAYLDFTIMAGSNFVGTNATWNAGQYYATSATTNFTGTVNNALSIAAVHLRPGYVDMTYLAKPLPQELNEARHWYLKSFGQRTHVAQNSGTAAGAASSYAPYAFATDTTIGIPVNFGVVMYDNNNNTAPTVTFYSTNAASGNCYDATKAADAGAASAINAGDNGMLISCGLISGDALGDLLQVQYDVDSGF